MRTRHGLAMLAILLGLAGVGRTGAESGMQTGDPVSAAAPDAAPLTEQVSFGLGCFWCAEAIFQRMDGVVAVVSGYQGGDLPNPSYKQVCSGKTGHAEVIRITYDPARVAFTDLLDVFWQAHDPTQVNRQGADVGTQYRSVIFTTTEAQREAAEASRQALQKSGALERSVATQILAGPTFYPAEPEHQNYYQNNRGAPYCRMVIEPKLRKLDLKAPGKKR